MKKNTYTSWSNFLDTVSCTDQNISVGVGGIVLNKDLRNLKKSLGLILSIEDLKANFVSWLKKNPNFLFVVENYHELKKIAQEDKNLLRSKDINGNNYLHYCLCGSYESQNKKNIIDFFLQNYPSLFLELNDSGNKPVDIMRGSTFEEDKVKIYIQNTLIKLAQEGKSIINHKHRIL